MWNTILFDLDGTLTDSGEGITKSVKYALEKGFGKQVEDLSELRIFVGPPLKDMFMQYAGLNEEEVERAVELYRERYTDTGIFENEVYPGIVHLLEILKANHFRLGVASSKPEHFCHRVLEHFGIDQYFDTIVGSGMDGSRVRKSEVLEEALKRLGMEERRDEVVLVGDTKFDMIGAKEAGVSSVGVTYGYGSREELEHEWPDCIVDNTTELKNVLLGQARAENNDGTILKRIWRVAYPMLIDVAFSYLATMLIGIILVQVMKDVNISDVFMRNGVLITGITDAILIPLFLWFMYRDEKRRKMAGVADRIPVKYGFHPLRWLEVAFYAICVSETISFLTSFIRINDTSYQTVEQMFESTGTLMQVLVLALIGPVMEELLFRGVIFRRVRDYLGFGWGAVISGIFFGIAHGNLTQGIYAALFGVVLAMLYEHFGTIAAPLTAHIANNLFSLFGVYLMAGMSPILTVLMMLGFMLLTVLITIEIFGEKDHPNSV